MMTSFEVFPVVKEIFCPDVLRSGAPKLNKKNCSEKDIVLSKRGTDSVTVVYKTSPLAYLHLYIYWQFPYNILNRTFEPQKVI